jgi:anti-sigma factor RsiW
VTCDDVAALLSPDTDGEIDALRSHAIRRHVAGCAACAARLQALQALKAQIRTDLPRHTAPAALRQHIAALIADAPRRHSTWRAMRWPWFGGGAAAGALATGLLWAVVAGPLRPGTMEDLSAQIVGVHTRATLGSHLIEIASSDRHRVKPWLSARLDYAIPVTDWAQSGFPLLGARIERLDGRPVAALVYQYRDHVIDVFVRPDDRAGSVPTVRAVRGFYVAAARGSGMQWLATSDLNGSELEAFVRGLATGSVAPPN